jgi:hypothetical protein
MKNRSTIWKYQFDIDDTVIIDMPRDARIISLQMQNHLPALWAVVTPSNPVVRRVILIRGTGHPMGEALNRPHIGTFQLDGGLLVFHAFDGGER